jgi:hypothetical protein
MPDPSPTDTLAAFTLTYPFPIAFALKEAVLGATDDERRVRGIIQTFTLGIQYAALVCAGEYARADYRDEQLSWSLESLKRPLISHFANFLQAALRSFAAWSLTPLVADLPAFGSSLQVKVGVPVMVDGVEREKSLTVPKALEELRNTLAHRAFHADWPRLAGRYLGHLTTFLQALDWCRRYPLLRLVGDGRVVRLMGAATQFAAEPLPDAALPELARAQQEGRLSGLLLAGAGLTRFLSLPAADPGDRRRQRGRQPRPHPPGRVRVRQALRRPSRPRGGAHDRLGRQSGLLVPLRLLRPGAPGARVQGGRRRGPRPVPPRRLPRP